MRLLTEGRTHASATDGRLDVAAAVAWCLGGLAWNLQNFLPWTTTGLLARTSPVEAAGLLRGGLFDELFVPVAGAVLLLPITGLALVMLTLLGACHRWRTAAWSLGVVSSVTATYHLAGTSPEHFGPGAWCALLGCVLPLAALLLPTQRPSLPVGAP